MLFDEFFGAFCNFCRSVYFQVNETMAFAGI